MGKRGPVPTPTAILKLTGSWRAGLNRDEPIPPAGPPECPDWLEPEAKAAWEYLCPVLEVMRVLTLADRNALARYCQFWARWRQCEEHVSRYGTRILVKDKDGNPRGYKEAPEARLSLRLSQEMNRLEAVFGLTPSARSRLVAHVEGRPDFDGEIPMRRRG